MQEKVIDGEVVKRSIKWYNYGCSASGRIFRWDTEKEMAISVRTREKDYPTFRACHDNRPSNVCVHVIIAECWLVNDSPEIKVDVNHINGNKKDFRLENLEWVTKSQNQRHALESGLKQKGDELYNSQLSNDEVHIVCQKLQGGARAKDLAEEFGVSIDIIRKIKDGSTYFHIRQMYPMEHKYKKDFSEVTVRWVCDKIIKGYSDKAISEMSTNKDLVIIEIKRIRNKIRYRHITDEYF